MQQTTEVLPVSAVIPTFDRPHSLERSLDSLVAQNKLPAQLIVIDGSPAEETRMVVEAWAATVGSQCEVVYQRAFQLGAAAQRNQGVAIAAQPFIWFFDDDIVFESDCVKRLWAAIKSDEAVGGVNAMITNQRYAMPGLVTRTLFRLLYGKSCESYAGKCIGPALNILPEDNTNLPDVVPVEWLNTTCAIYRREALPSPPFDSHFTGYSFMEDVALSLTVGKKWKLKNARTARIYHDSQPAEYKSNPSTLASMELINRHYVMTRILGRTSAIDYAKLTLLEAFGMVTPLVSERAWKSLPAVLIGKAQGIVAMQRGEKIEGASLSARPFFPPIRGAHRGTPLQTAENCEDLGSTTIAPGQ
ncbi:MAG: glycosyltransferase family 2 protein [bacterium]